MIKTLYANIRDSDVKVNEWIKRELREILSKEFMYLPKKKREIISFIKRVPDHFIRGCFGPGWKEEIERIGYQLCYPT